jgi:protein involved in polysaccharide export with SLBB domain
LKAVKELSAFADFVHKAHFTMESTVMSIRKMMYIGFAVLVVLLLGSFDRGVADEYRIGPDDVLEINFWQAPSFNTTVRAISSVRSPV